MGKATFYYSESLIDISPPIHNLTNSPPIHYITDPNSSRIYSLTDQLPSSLSDYFPVVTTGIVYMEKQF